jgi:hypothetical protein
VIPPKVKGETEISPTIKPISKSSSPAGGFFTENMAKMSKVDPRIYSPLGDIVRPAKFQFYNRKVAFDRGELLPTRFNGLATIQVGKASIPKHVNFDQFPT